MTINAREEFQSLLAEQLADHFGCPLMAMENAVAAATAEWEVWSETVRRRDQGQSDAPLRRFAVRLPWCETQVAEETLGRRLSQLGLSGSVKVMGVSEVDSES